MITSEIRGVDAVLSTLVNLPKQLRFAASQALNDTAKDIQTWTLNDLLPSKFTLRAKGNPWQKPGTKYGFNIKFANKENLESRLGSQADWLKLQEHGGIKSIVGHRVAEPTAFWKRREEIMARSKKPRALLRGLQSELRAANIEAGKTHKTLKSGRSVIKSQRNRIADIRTRNRIKKQIASAGSLQHQPFLNRGSSLPAGIYVRSTANRLPIHRLFTFTNSAAIKAVLDFEPQGTRRAEQVYVNYFNRRLAYAILTAK